MLYVAGAARCVLLTCFYNTSGIVNARMFINPQVQAMSALMSFTFSSTSNVLPQLAQLIGTPVWGGLLATLVGIVGFAGVFAAALGALCATSITFVSLAMAERVRHQCCEKKWKVVLFLEQFDVSDYCSELITISYQDSLRGYYNLNAFPSCWRFK